MGCNDYNLHLDSSSGEQPTPEYNIYLDGVGVNGYSPTVDIVNSTSSSFQIQVNDVDGTELTSPIPKLDYIANNYVSNTSLASTLANYSTTSEIASAYLKVDGSNANNPITVNGIVLRNYSNYSNMIKAKDGLNLELSNGGSIVNNTRATINLATDGNATIYGDNNINIHSYQGNVRIYSNSGKAYYGTIANENELATIGDIPTVSDATITLTQGGVTKGTFTLNGSAATIDLDEGGGSITNPLVIQNTDEDRKLYFGINSSNQLYMRYDLIYNSGGGQITIPYDINLIAASINPINISNYTSGLKSISLNYNTNTLELDANNYLNVKGMTGADGTNAGSAGLVPAPTATDNDKYLCGDGTWKEVQGGGTTYSAGYGIDIDNNTIAVDSDVVIRINNQTISGIKQFNDQIAFPKASNQTFLSYNDNGTYTAIVRMVDSNTIKFSSGTMNGLIASGGELELSAGSDKNIVFNANGTSKKVFYGNPNTASNEVAKLGDIPDTTYMVTTNTAQTISGSKTFSSETHHTGVITFDSALLNPIIRGMSGSSYRNMIYRMGNDSAIIVGNSNDTIDLKGSGTRPTYNTNSLALYSDIPSLTGYATETWVGNQGYLTGISSTDVVNALGYTPYSNSNPSGYTSNVGTVTSVNNTQPDANGNVTINLTPTVIDGGNA